MIENAMRRALIVDDEGPIRKLIAQALSKEAFQCETAENGWQGLEMATAQHFDVVVTDLIMGKGDGHAFCKGLLNLDKRPCIIVLTGNVDPAIVTDMIERGVDDIAFKPINFSAFAAKVRSLVDRKGLLQETMTRSLGCNTKPAKSVDEVLSLPQASINTLEGSVHDFNNQLQTIHGYTKHALAELPAGSLVHEDLGQVMDASNRAIMLVQQIGKMVRRHADSENAESPH